MGGRNECDRDRNVRNCAQAADGARAGWDRPCRAGDSAQDASRRTDAGAALARPIPRLPRRLDRQCGSACDQGRSAFRAAEPAVGRQRLCGHLRRPAAARWARRGSRRPAADSRQRARPLRDRFACRWACADRGSARSRPPRPGSRRGDDVTGRALGLDHNLHRPARPQPGARGVGGRPWSRRGLRRRSQRRPHRRARVALDLLPQRAGRDPRRPRRARAPRPRTPSGQAERLRLPRSGARHSRDAASDLRARPGSRDRLGHGRDDERARGRSRASRGLRCQRAPCTYPARAVLDLPDQGACRRQRHPAHHLQRPLLDVFLPQPLHAEGTRLFAQPHRPRLPAAHRRLHDLGRDRDAARAAHWDEAGDRRRRPRRGRGSLFPLARAGGRGLPRRPATGHRPRRPRSGGGFHRRDDRRDRGCAGRPRRHRLRALERLDAVRRRVRACRPFRGGYQPHRRCPRLRWRPSTCSHCRLPARLPDRRPVRARRSARGSPGSQRPFGHEGMTAATGKRGYRTVSAVLFLCLFAGQAGAIALSPVLAQVARDLDVSTAEAGQLRTVAGLVAGLTALALGSLASAAAPGIGWLAVAQIPVGAGIAILTTAGTLAAAEWVSPARRAATLSWVLIGQPAAWMVGMPLLGAAGGHSWRYAWLTLPLIAALLAGAAVAGRGQTAGASTAAISMRATLEAPGLGRWLVAELLTNSAWAGMLVYAGALLVESYQASTALTGAVLALGAGAYVFGNLAFRRLADRESRGLLIRLSVVLAVATALFGALRPSLLTSTALFAAAAFAAGGRTLLSSAFGLAAAPELRRSAMAMRAASMQFGYFAGSVAAGAALAAGGYAAFGATIGVLFLSAALVLGGSPSTRPRRLRIAPSWARE